MGQLSSFPVNYMPSHDVFDISIEGSDIDQVTDQKHPALSALELAQAAENGQKRQA
jgi:hypothetical protein